MTLMEKNIEFYSWKNTFFKSLSLFFVHDYIFILII